jgi:hypothetical protein
VTQQDARFIILPGNAHLVGFMPQSVGLDHQCGRVGCDGDSIKEAVEMLANIRITGWPLRRCCLLSERTDGESEYQTQDCQLTHRSYDNSLFLPHHCTLTWNITRWLFPNVA